MRPELLNHPFHNPFYNRFNDPVRRREDMQSHEYTVWLRDQNRLLPPKSNNANNAEYHRWGGAFAGALVLFVVALFSVAVFLKMF